MIPVKRIERKKKFSEEKSPRRWQAGEKKDELERLSKNERFHVVHSRRFLFSHVRHRGETVFDESRVGPAVEGTKTKTKTKTR